MRCKTSFPFWIHHLWPIHSMREHTVSCIATVVSRHTDLFDSRLSHSYSTEFLYQGQLDS